MLKILDRALLNGVFQPLSNWLMKVTGKSNFWFAKACFWVLVVLFSADTVKHPSAFQIFSCIFIGFIVLACIRSCEQADNRNMESLKHSDAFVSISGPARTFIVLLSIFFIMVESANILLFHNLMDQMRGIAENILYPSAFYLAACERPKDPLSSTTLAHQSS